MFEDAMTPRFLQEKSAVLSTKKIICVFESITRNDPLGESKKYKVIGREGK